MSRMGISTLWGKVAALIALCGWALSAQAKYAGGSGEPNNPYQISSVADWQELMATPADWDSHFVLTVALDLEGIPLSPVGVRYSAGFTGVFDGNDYVIRNADVNMPASGYVGLFGYLGPDGEIKNLGVEETSILGKYDVGALVGENHGIISNCYSTALVSGVGAVGGLVGYNGSGHAISNCYSTGSVTGSGDEVGALVGVNWDGIISNCYSTGTVSGGDEYIGGLVGENFWGAISNCYSTGSVNGNKHVGGLVGENHHGTISNCYSSGTVSGTGYYVGGLVGTNGHYEWVCELKSCWYELYPGWIYNCYSSGTVSGTGYYVGGLVGVHWEGEVGDCFWDIETSEWNTSAGGTPKTTEEMKTQSTFTDAGWDFIGIWDIGENHTYPFLRTYVAGDINHDGVVDFRDIAHLAESWLRDVR